MNHDGAGLCQLPGTKMVSAMCCMDLPRAKMTFYWKVSSVKIDDGIRIQGLDVFLHILMDFINVPY